MKSKKLLKIMGTFFLVIGCVITAFSQEGLKNFDEGIQLMEKRNYEKAIEVFSSGIELDDVAKSINHYGRAYAYFELDKFESAKADIVESLRTEKMNGENMNREIYWLKGMIASEEGDRKMEIESYEKAIEYAPDNLQLKTTLSFALIENNQAEKAIDLLNVVLEKNNQDPYAYNNRALALIKIGALERAKIDLDRSKSLDSQNPFLYKNYFHYYQEKKDMNNACQALEEAMKMDMTAYGSEKDAKVLIALKKEYCN